jgi:hypothetical protein
MYEFSVVIAIWRIGSSFAWGKPKIAVCACLLAARLVIIIMARECNSALEELSRESATTVGRQCKGKSTAFAGALTVG